MLEKMIVDWMDCREYQPEHAWLYFVSVKWSKINPFTFEVESGLYTTKAYYEPHNVVYEDELIRRAGWYVPAYDGSIDAAKNDDETDREFSPHETVVSWAHIPSNPEPWDPSAKKD